MDRRRFLLTSLAGALTVPAAAGAQQDRSDTGPIHVGVLGYGPGQAGQSDSRSAFRAKLADLGYVAGQNLVIDERSAHGRRERLPALVAELIALHVRVLVVVGPYVLKIANSVETTTPIVAIDLESDPV